MIFGCCASAKGGFDVKPTNQSVVEDGKCATLSSATVLKQQNVQPHLFRFITTFTVIPDTNIESGKKENEQIPNPTVRQETIMEAE